MKKTLAFFVAAFIAVITCSAQSYSTGVNPNSTYVNGYTKSNGTYVPGHYRSKPNSTNRDNYSTQGNRNPYNGNSGYRAPDYSSGASNYGSGHTIHTGPRGGQYYINSKGNKTYVPKR
ncbi:MAG: hypothetical protein J1E63_10705 [Muribaculaceae bacterium]|nr:hypothetical protein [Muribaculaceae bacterium]